MRICPVSNYNYSNSARLTQQNVKSPNFKSGGGALGVIGGCAVGIGLTILTGGAAAPFVPFICVGGAVAGEGVKEHLDSKKNN